VKTKSLTLVSFAATRWSPPRSSARSTRAKHGNPDLVSLNALPQCRHGRGSVSQTLQ
jgi:hypothetical protein